MMIIGVDYHPGFQEIAFWLKRLVSVTNDQSGRAMSHGGDGFGSTELGAQASVLRAQVCLAF